MVGASWAGGGEWLRRQRCFLGVGRKRSWGGGVGGIGRGREGGGGVGGVRCGVNLWWSGGWDGGLVRDHMRGRRTGAVVVVKGA